MQLLPDVEYLEEPPLFIWRPRGVLNEEKISQIIAFITEQETRFGRSTDRFTDLSLLDAIDVTFKFVFQVALYRRLSRISQETIKSAFLVTTPAVARYVKLHAVLTDHSPLQVELFQEREAAAEWLGVPVNLLAAKP
jgi:hypothetical protein